MMHFEGERIVVFGGSSGIGFACARAFAAGGGAVVLAARDEARLRAAAERLGGATAVASVDVTDETAVRALFDRVGEVHHAVVSAAPAATMGRLVDIGAEGVRFSLLNKALGQATATIAAARRVVAGGSVTVVSGVAGRKRASKMGAVGMANAALDAMVAVLAGEVAPTRVNAVAPGMVDTNMYAGMPEDQRQALYAQVGASLPVGRVGRPEDIATVVLALAASGFATGTVVTVDGGSGLV